MSVYDRIVPEWEAFEYADAWRLGVLLHDLAAERGHGVAIDIRRPTGLILFRAVLPGATLDQEHWIRKKAALVFRFETSSGDIAERLIGAGVDVGAMGWLDPSEYALAGGSVPVKVRGAGIVAAATVSGLTSEGDHALVIEAMQRLLAESDN
ncbi:heme-binding protein [Microbacterium aoyamense]|uniref:Heme-binding protein n=1 Tax=Microbacterium aoyamense TaxID=344166 RepID=A0ABN2PM44_9MICO|nr:heme-binding protein [Microbacterium aoyamense]